MPDRQVIVRFAPSPNGYLHLGHAFSALLNDKAASTEGGLCLLRIEDIDQTRARAEFEAAIKQDLAWLGLIYQPGILRQSDRFAAYGAAIAELQHLGLLYPAFMSRREIRTAIADRSAGGRSWPRDPDNAPFYPGPERDWPDARRKAEMDTGKPFALRLDMQRTLDGLPNLSWIENNPFDASKRQRHAADPAAWGDVVIARSDVPASYHLSVVVDDAFQSVSHIIRGLDLAPSTSVHRTLQHLLDLPVPDYFHHRLLYDDDGQKLSKRAGSESLRSLRGNGLSPDDIVSRLQPYVRQPAPQQRF